jgi:hypothetical protein
MIYITILCLLFSIILMLNERDKFTMFLVLLNVLSVLIALLINKSIGFYIYGFTLLFTLIYFIKISNHSQRKLYIIFTIPILINYITAIFNLINLPFIEISQLVSIIIFIYISLKQFKSSIKELSVILPLFIYTCINLFNYFS